MNGLPPGYEAHRTEDMTFVCRSGEADRIRETGLGDLFNIEDMIASGERRGRGRIFEVPPPEDFPGEALMLKQLLHGGLYGRLNRERFLGAERALRELRVTARARERGVPVPEIAFVAWTPGGLSRLYLATVRVPGSRNLDEVLRDEPPGRARALALRAAARAVREMHDAGLVHGDLNFRNVMITESEGSPEGFVLDLDRSFFPESLTDDHRAANLARLLRSVLKSPVAAARTSLRERAAFLRDYCRGSGPERRRLEARIRRRAASFGLHRLAWRLGWR